jgi:hypothetical protein
MRNGACGHDIEIDRQFGLVIVRPDLPVRDCLSNAGRPIKLQHVRTERRVIGEAANVIAQAVWVGVLAASALAAVLRVTTPGQPMPKAEPKSH